MSSRLANGDAIRKIRNEMRMTQRAFAKKFCVGERWISKIERYEGTAEEGALREFADNLGVTFEDITVAEGEEMAHLKANAPTDDEEDESGEFSFDRISVPILGQIKPHEGAIAVEFDDDGKPWTETDDMNLIAAIRHLRALSKPSTIRFFKKGSDQ